MIAGVTTNFGPFCSGDFSSVVTSFLERLITYLSWKLEVVVEVAVVVKVLVVLEAILETVVETLEVRCLSFLIWVFLYCRDVSFLLLKMVFCKFVKVGSSSFSCSDVLGLSISVWRWLILILVHLILVWMSECSAFLIITCANLFPFHLICKVFGVTSLGMNLRLKVLAVHDLASCIVNFS